VDKSVEVAATEKFNARRITLMAVREPSVIAVKYGYRETFRGDVPTNPAPTASGNPIREPSRLDLPSFRTRAPSAIIHVGPNSTGQ
jgi:hypothetical protein